MSFNHAFWFLNGAEFISQWHPNDPIFFFFLDTKTKPMWLNIMKQPNRNVYRLEINALLQWITYENQYIYIPNTPIERQRQTSLESNIDKE